MDPALDTTIVDLPPRDALAIRLRPTDHPHHRSFGGHGRDRLVVSGTVPHVQPLPVGVHHLDVPTDLDLRLVGDLTHLDNRLAARRTSTAVHDHEIGPHRESIDTVVAERYPFGAGGVRDDGTRDLSSTAIWHYGQHTSIEAGSGAHPQAVPVRTGHLHHVAGRRNSWSQIVRDDPALDAVSLHLVPGRTVGCTLRPVDDANTRTRGQTTDSRGIETRCRPNVHPITIRSRDLAEHTTGQIVRSGHRGKQQGNSEDDQTRGYQPSWKSYLPQSTPLPSFVPGH
ncbi:hypothetical protein HRbin27_01723 [bacterium HR27]|nr:hypothetical protein HRbin27_01723 [bacterium HR27]